MPPPAQSPSEIAREVFRRLAMNRVPPTPENFRELYYQISGGTAEDPFPERELRGLASRLPRDTPEQLRIARRFDGVIAEGTWEAFHTRMAQLFADSVEARPPWAVLIRDLLSQLERRHATLSRTRKEEALDHVLSSSQGDPQQLFQRLQGLVKGWSGEAEGESIALVEGDIPPLPEPAATPAGADRPVPATVSSTGFEMRSLVAQILEDAVGGLLIETPQLTDAATALAAELRTPGDRFDLTGFSERLRAFAYKVEWVVRDQAGIRQALLRLLQLILENINDLVLDDRWLQGQVASVLEVTSMPMDRDAIDEVGRRLRDVILKQGVLKKSLIDAQDRLKAMLSGFVDHLSDFYDTTGGYGSRLERCAERVAQAESMTELTAVIEEIVRETRTMQHRADTSRTELDELKRKVDAANAEVNRLQHELDAASEMVRHDPLTGVLNRKGLDEALDREIGRVQRNKKPLCLALIDVDNFKQLNDTLGHGAGDDALVHLAHVIGDTIRPQDAVARYGGEEFVVVLPDTELDDGVSVIQRLQRELTKRFFLHENRKLLITFSAGVAQLAREEPPQRTLDRADEAMYRAKRAGKNRVEPAR